MTISNWLILTSGGLFSGVLAGFLGIGGGTFLVPFLVQLGYLPVEAVATSSLAVVVTSSSASLQNWRMGYLDWKRVLALGFPAFVTAQAGVYIADRIPSYVLLIAFGILLLTNIYLVNLRKRLMTEGVPSTHRMSPMVARLTTGGTAGFLAGLFGVGGGVIMVPLQMLWLAEPIKIAIQTSLGVVVITGISACVGHAIALNILFIPGLILGAGGLLGAQISTRLLPQLPDQMVSLIFRGFLAMLSISVFWQAWKSYS